MARDVMCFAGTRLALIQRSCGYALRPTLSISDVQRAARIIKDQKPDCVVAVDNCYGEFTEDQEPCAVRTQPFSLKSKKVAHVILLIP